MRAARREPAQNRQASLGKDDAMQVNVDDPAELRIARSAADHHSALDDGYINRSAELSAPESLARRGPRFQLS